MSLFQFGFTVKETVNSQNSAAHSQPANAGSCAFLPEQEATNLGSEEYNEVVLSVGDAVDPNKNLSSKSEEITTITLPNCVHKSVNMLAKTEI